MKNFKKATIVGAAAGIDLASISNDSDVFALNSAYFYLKENGVQPAALITGDKRFIARAGQEKISSVKRLITFLDADTAVNTKLKSEIATLELFRCLGRDGFSADKSSGFYHGCSSFFFAVQYLICAGYKHIKTVGINFPPPEMYNRLNGVKGHPEFVYDIQLSNLAAMKKFVNDTDTTIQCMDAHSNLNIFL